MATTLRPVSANRRIHRRRSFFYGFRYVTIVDAHGKQVTRQVGLTPDEVLHPREGYFVVHSDLHHRRCTYLANVLRHHLANEPGTRVFSDLLVVWNDPDIKPHAPDISVFRNVPPQDEWREMNLCNVPAHIDLVMEVTSRSTAKLDRRNKVDEYLAVGVPWYVLIDGVRGETPIVPRIRVRRLVAGHYQDEAPDDHGRYWLPPVGLWLAVVNDEIELQTPDGRRLETYDEIAERAIEAESARAAADAAREAAETAAAAERAARLALEERLRQAEAQLRTRASGGTND